MNDDPGVTTRNAIIDALQSQGGGTYKRELCRLTGRGWGNIGHHVYDLVQTNSVETEIHGRQLWVFLPSTSRMDRDWLVATRVPERRRLLDFIHGQPKTINTLSEEMATSKKIVRTHLQHLQRYGAVTATEGYPPKYEPSPRAKNR